MSDTPEHRLSLFVDDLRQLLWKYKAELSVELDRNGKFDFDAALRVYWSDETYDRLPRTMVGQERTH